MHAPVSITLPCGMEAMDFARVRSSLLQPDDCHEPPSSERSGQ